MSIDVKVNRSARFLHCFADMESATRFQSFANEATDSALKLVVIGDKAGYPWVATHNLPSARIENKVALLFQAFVEGMVAERMR